LLLYTPLFLVGYKHFHDALLLKSLVDVLFDRDLRWTRAARIEQRAEQSTEQPTETSRLDAESETTG